MMKADCRYRVILIWKLDDRRNRHTEVIILYYSVRFLQFDDAFNALSKNN